MITPRRSVIITVIHLAEKQMAHQINSTPVYKKKWQKLALISFIIAWTTMLLPMLYSPESKLAQIYLTICLFGGGALILTIFASEFLTKNKCYREPIE